MSASDDPQARIGEVVVPAKHGSSARAADPHLGDWRADRGQSIQLTSAPPAGSLHDAFLQVEQLTDSHIEIWDVPVAS